MTLRFVSSSTGLPSKRCPGIVFLMKSGLGNRGRSAFGTTHVASLEFPHDIYFIKERITFNVENIDMHFPYT